VNLGVAKDQRLSLNPAQISGACGRLMCCLRYEHEFYVQSRKRFPKEGKILTTSKGEEKLMAIDIFHERLTLRTAEGETRIVPLAEFNREMEAVAGGNLESYLNDTGGDDAEPTENGFEISPELLYTMEHEVSVTKQHVVSETQPEQATADATAGSDGGDSSSTRAGDRDDSGARRRRGRRGGRRGRGGEPGEPS
jgi:hypothetical protein